MPYRLDVKKIRLNLSGYEERIGKIISERLKSKSKDFNVVTQERALRAIDLGLGIKSKGFNIFVCGEPGTGRTSTVKQILKKVALTEKSPGDIILLYNFFIN